MGLLITIAVLALIITGFFLPMAWARFAALENFGSAFQLQALARDIKAVASRYFTVLLLLLGLWVIVISFSLIPVVGWVLSAFGAFYIHMVTSLLYGEVYRRSLAYQG